MNKNEFFKELKYNLKSFNFTEVKKITDYYEELIEEKKENGISEEDAIKSFGDIKNIVNNVSAELVMERIENKNSKTISNFFIILGICASPILLPIGISFFAVFVSIVAVFFSLVVSFSVSSFAILIASIPYSIHMYQTGVEASVILIVIGSCLVASGVLVMLSLITYKVGRNILNIILKVFSKLIKKITNKEK